MKKLNVLSLFDGISGGQIALNRLGYEIENYYASEIKPKAIEVTMQHFPKTIQVGDITKLKYEDGFLINETDVWYVGEIDLVLGGSPCQDFSALKSINHERLGYEGEKSKLFFEYVRILKEVNPKYFLLENVKMKKEHEEVLNDIMRVQPNRINSSLVSIQTRDRLYWTNINGGFIPQPTDKKLNLQDHLDDDELNLMESKMNYTKSRIKMWSDGNGKGLGVCKNITNATKCGCITRKQDRCPNSGLIAYDGFARYLTRKEIEIGQTLPLGYLDMCSYTLMQDLAGDGWTIDVICHILKYMEEE